MKKVVLLLVLIACLFLSSCSNEKENASEKDEIVLAYICKSLDQQWFQDVSKSLKEQALKMGAKDVIMLDARMQPDLYIAALDNVIAQNVDGIIACIPDKNLSRVTISKTKEAGIPLLADADPIIENGVRLAPSLELDAFLVGQQSSEWLVNHIKENNLVEDIASTGYAILTMDTVSSCVPRAEGQYEAFTRLYSEFPKEQIIKADYNGEIEKGYNVMAATITANPKYKKWFVTAANEEGALGAVRALEQAGLDGEAVVVGLGGYHAKDEFKKDYSAMKSAAYFSAEVNGVAVATAMMEHILEGKKIFAEYKKEGQEFGMYPLGAIMVTPENYKDVMKENAN